MDLMTRFRRGLEREGYPVYRISGRSGINRNAYPVPEGGIIDMLARAIRDSLKEWGEISTRAVEETHLRIETSDPFTRKL